jgi:hypothetical protein
LVNKLKCFDIKIIQMLTNMKQPSIYKFDT